MNIRIFHIFALLGAALPLAATEAPDTLVNAAGAQRVVVTETPQGMSVHVQGVHGNPASSVTYTQSFDNDGGEDQGRGHRTTRTAARSLPFSLPGDCGCNDGAPRVEGVVSGVGIGLSHAYDAPSGWNLEMGHSLQITWPMILGVRCRLAPSNSVAAGVGVGWRNYKSTSGAACMAPNGQGGVGTGAFGDVADPLSSRIKVFSLQVPVVFSQYLGFSWPGGGRARLSLGAVFNWNAHASLETAWRDARGNVVREYHEGLHQRKCTIDPYAALAFGVLSVYAQYSPMTVLHGHGSPDMRPLTVGIGIGMP